MKNLLPGICSFILVVLLASMASATIVVKLTNKSMTEKSELIAIGKCVGTKSVWMDRQLVTLVTISITEVLKGSKLSTLTVVLPGGIDANRKFPVAETWPGAPILNPQEEVFLFLSSEKRVNFGYTIMGFSQGKFSVAKDKNGHKTVSRDLSGVTLAEKSKESIGTSSMLSLDEFKKEILGYLGKGVTRPRK
jgi:hypothetical protein